MSALTAMYIIVCLLGFAVVGMYIATGIFKYFWNDYGKNN